MFKPTAYMARITDSGFQMLIDNLDSELKDYLARFEEVTAKQSQRDELVNNTLNVIGPQMERNLTAIMESAFTDGDAESTSTGGSSIPIIAPVAGKLLKVFLRSNKNLNSLTFTWRLETQAGVNFGTGPSVVGTQSGAGCQNTTMTTYDFTSSLDSGDNLIDAGDAVYLSIQSGGATSSTKFYITCLWEWDLS